MKPIITVTSAAVSRKLLEASFVRDRLNLSVSEIGDQKLDELIDGVSAFVESECDRKLIRETVSEQWRFRQSQEDIWLTRWPVNSVTSITEDSDAALTADYWELDYDTGRLARRDGSDYTIRWMPNYKVVIVYNAGYTAADETGANIPADLRDAALDILKSNWFSMERDPYLRSEDVPGVAKYSYGFGAAEHSGLYIPPDAQARLANYRRASVG